MREDLYYRLNVLPIEVPPLRERREDIPLLAKYFLHRFSEANGKRISSIGNDVLDVLEQYDWPGNVRQLENVTQRMVILSPNGHIVRELCRPNFWHNCRLLRWTGPPNLPRSTT